ncbi:MAG: methyltransferase domain-containing protein [Promethearchaeota archaeon]
MPLALNIGYTPAQIDFFDRKFNKIKEYIDFVDIKSSFLVQRNSIASIVRALSSKSIRAFLESGGFFNLNFDVPRDSNYIPVNSTKSKNNFLDFITEFSDTPAYFQDSCNNLILPVILDGDSSLNHQYKNSLSNFILNNLNKIDRIFDKLLIRYHFIKNNSEIEYYINEIERYEGDYKNNIKESFSLFLNIPEWHQKLGQKKTLQLLRKLRDTGRKVEVYQIADYQIIDNQVHSNITIGEGRISWRPFLSYFKNSNILLATKDGISSVKKSMAHLGEISINKKDRIDGNSVVTGFFFSRDKKSFFQSSPGTKMALKYIKDNKINVNSILDLGCGNGRNSFYLSKNIDAKAHLIDIDRDLLNYVKLKFKTFNVKTPEIEVIDLENFDLSLFNTKYDITLLSYVLQNIFPANYFKLMDFCRIITRKLMIFEIYVNLNVYPEGMVTKRGETFWYGFSSDEVFKLFESFFDVIGWDVKKGKANPLMISIVGKPRDTVTNGESILRRYNNIQTVDYSSIRKIYPKKQVSTRKKVKTISSTKRKERMIDKTNTDHWRILSSHLLSTGLSKTQISVLESKLEELDSSYKLKAPENFGALLFLVARLNRIPIHLQEIVKILDVRRKDIHRTMKEIQYRHNIARNLPSLEAFFERYFTILNLNEIYERSPSEIIEEIKNNYNCNLLGSLPHISALAIAIHLLRSSDKRSNPSQLARKVYISPSSLKNKLRLLEGIQLVQ